MIIVLYNDTLSQTGQPSNPLVDFRKPRRTVLRGCQGQLERDALDV